MLEQNWVRMFLRKGSNHWLRNRIMSLNRLIFYYGADCIIVDVCISCVQCHDGNGRGFKTAMCSLMSYNKCGRDWGRLMWAWCWMDSVCLWDTAFIRDVLDLRTFIFRESVEVCTIILTFMALLLTYMARLGGGTLDLGCVNKNNYTSCRG